MMVTPETPRRTIRGLERLTATTLFLVPLLMHPWGQSLCGRIKDVALWTTAAIAGWLLLTLCSSRISAVSMPPRLTRPAMAWLVVLALSVPMAASKVAGAWGALGVLPAVVLAISVATVSRRASGRARLEKAWVASASLVSLYAIFQHYGISPIPWPHNDPLLRASGSIGAPTYLGSFLALALPFAVPLFLFRRRPRWLAPGVVVIIAALTVTYSRGPWAAAVAGVWVTLYAAPHVVERAMAKGLRISLGVVLCLVPAVYLLDHRFFTPVAAVAAMGLAWWAWGFAEDRRFLRMVGAGLALSVVLVTVDTLRPLSMAADRLSDAGNPKNESISLRLGLWRDATQMIVRRPLLGWGPDGFRMGASGLAHDNTAFPQVLLYPHQASHSEWYTAAVNSGLPGLLVWVGFLLATTSVAADRARAARSVPAPSRVDRNHSNVAAAVFGALVAFAVQGSVTPLAPTTTMGLALCWGLVAAIEPRTRVVRKMPRPVTRLVAPTWAAGCLSIAVALLMADTIAGTANRAQKQERYDIALPAFASAARWNPMDPDYVRAWGQSALRLAQKSSGEGQELAARQAVAAYRKNIAIEPTNGAWHAGAAQALSYLDPKAALHHGMKAVEVSPLSANAWWSLACAHRANNDPGQEKEALLAAISVDPIVPEPYIRLAGIFREGNRPDISERLLIYAADTWKYRKDLEPWRGRSQARVVSPGRG